MTHNKTKSQNDCLTVRQSEEEAIHEEMNFSGQWKQKHKLSEAEARQINRDRVEG